MTNADKLAIIAREIEAVRAARPVVGHLNGVGYAAGAPAVNGREAGPTRRTPCGCGGEHSFHPSDDSDVEGLFAERTLQQPDEDAADYSVSNGHVPDNGYASLFRPPANGSEIGDGVGQGRLDLDRWQDRGSAPTLRPRSLGAAAHVWSVGDEMAGDAMESPRWLKRLLHTIAPSPMFWWGWGVIALGAVLKFYGLI